MFKRFVIYGLLGFCGEVLWTGLGSMMKGDIKLMGWTYIWMFPIYAMAILLEPIHNRIRHLSIFIRGGVYTVLIFIGEFISGIILKGTLGVCPWDYTGKPLSIYGIITLTYIPVWFMVGLIFEKIHDTLIGIEQILKESQG